jgi:microcystin-dependent protein
MSLTKTQLDLFNSAVEVSNARVKLPVRTSAQRNAITQEGSILYNDTDKSVQYRNNIGWNDLTPVGVIQMYGGSAAPTGWLICDGSIVSQTTYATLFAIIGSTYNTGGEGAGNFRLPDFRRRTAVGAGGTGTGVLGNALGNRGGTETHTLTTSEMPAHSHNLPGANFLAWDTHPVGAFALQAISGAFNTAALLPDTGGNQPHNNIQPSLVVNYIIKT